MLEPLIELRSVSKRFRIDDRVIRVLDGFSLTIEAGEFVTILGPSGCGKTTLLRILAGLDTVDAGAAVFEGKPIAGPHDGTAMMFQSYDCFPWMTVAANVRIGLASVKASPTEKGHRIKDALESVGLGNVDRAYPYQLSGGMRQRVALARTLVGRPRILLMDEPFGALDAQIREELQDELLRVFRRGEAKTIVFVTHDVVEAIRLGTRVIVLSEPPAKVVCDNRTRRSQATAQSDEDLMARCRSALVSERGQTT